MYKAIYRNKNAIIFFDITSLSIYNLLQTVGKYFAGVAYFAYFISIINF